MSGERSEVPALELFECVNNKPTDMIEYVHMVQRPNYTLFFSKSNITLIPSSQLRLTTRILIEEFDSIL